MSNINLSDFYQTIFQKNHFFQVTHVSQFNSVGQCWQLSPEVGAGYYWIYTQQNLYSIKIHDFYFHEDSFLEFNFPKCLSITQYESISGEELLPYRKLSASCIKTFIGGAQPYKALIHKKIPIRAVGIEIMPAYYEDYLKKQYPNDYSNPFSAFKQMDQTREFSEMKLLLHQIRTYRGEGIAAGLFYESKVAEAISLIVDRQKKQNHIQEKQLSCYDIAHLKNLTTYLNDHYIYDVRLDQLSKIACMGTTKLKTSFKQMYGCTITEYVQQLRMSQAENLLTKTDLTIGQIAQAVGYSTSSRFAELFRKNTGILPVEFRRIVKQK